MQFSHNDLINVSHMVQSTRMLGPYERSVLWVHGCCFACEGCIAKSMREGPGNPMEINAVADVLCQSPSVEGVTLSGGEPFLQAYALSRLVDVLKARRNLGIIVYTGFTLKELLALRRDEPSIDMLLQKTDLLIDGRYEKELDHGEPLRGSANQVIHLLSERYREEYETCYLHGVRKAEIRVYSSEVQIIGVPSKDVFAAWEGFRQKARGIEYDD